MRVLSRLLLALFLVVAAGCDSQEDEPDAERIRGQWELEAVTDANEDRTVEFEQLGAFQAEFDETDYTLTLDPPEGETVTLASGGYTLQPTTNIIFLEGTVGTTPINIPAQYRLEGDDELEIIIPEEYNAIINGLVGFDFEGEITFTLTR